MNLTTAQIKVLDEVFFLEEEYLTPVQWAETSRVMPHSNVYKGAFSYERNPYLKEIVNHLQPSSPAKKIAIIKGAQIGLSAGVIENGIGWSIKYNPTNILLAAADAELAKESFNDRIDPMIDSAGLRHLIHSTSGKKRNMRTGDTETEKEFLGGKLTGRGLQNAGKWRQTSFQFIFADDIDAAKRSDKKEGSTVNLINQRAASYGDAAKIFYISTPTYKKTSIIEPLYLQGDQRKFMMPCPCCGSFIPIEFQLRQDNEFYGIVWDTDTKGKLINNSVRYRCQSCGDTFKEDGNKSKMLRNGYWQPTAEPSEPGFFSYHISALYAPPGMYNWEHYVRQFLAAVKSGDEGEMKTFNNVVLGKTWEEKTTKTSAAKISQNTRDYEVGTIPNELSNRDGNGDIVLVTCAADLNGLDTSNTRYDYDDARLDWEITAHSESGATYSIDQGSIGTFQRRKNIDGRSLWTYKHNMAYSVWDDFAKIITKEYITDEGNIMKIAMTGIDVGAYSHHVWTFINLMKGQAVCAGIKGDTEAKKVRLGADDQSYFSISKQESDLYIVRTNLIKNNLAQHMLLEWPSGKDQPPNFMNFPIPSQNKYTAKGFFNQYESEEKNIEVDVGGLDIAYRWEKKTSSAQNHFWDCRVYNMALANILMTLICKEAKQNYPSWQLFCKIIKN